MPHLEVVVALPSYYSFPSHDVNTASAALSITSAVCTWGPPSWCCAPRRKPVSTARSGGRHLDGVGCLAANERTPRRYIPTRQHGSRCRRLGYARRMASAINPHAVRSTIGYEAITVVAVSRGSAARGACRCDATEVPTASVSTKPFRTGSPRMTKWQDAAPASRSAPTTHQLRVSSPSGYTRTRHL